MALRASHSLQERLVSDEEQPFVLRLWQAICAHFPEVERKPARLFEAWDANGDGHLTKMEVSLKAWSRIELAPYS